MFEESKDNLTPAYKSSSSNTTSSTFKFETSDTGIFSLPVIFIFPKLKFIFEICDMNYNKERREGENGIKYQFACILFTGVLGR